MKSVLLPLALVLAIACASHVLASTIDDYDQDMIGTMYVEAYANDASDNNIWPTDAETYPGLGDWLSTSQTSGKWYAKTGSSKAINGTAFEGKDGYEPPQLTMLATGLDPNETYDVYAVYWAKNPEKATGWYSRVGLDGGEIIDCSYLNADNIFFDDGGTGVQGCEKKIGTVTGVSEVSILVEPPPNTAEVDYRTWFDGVSFATAPEPGMLSLLALGVGVLLFRIK